MLHESIQRESHARKTRICTCTFTFQICVANLILLLSTHGEGWSSVKCVIALVQLAGSGSIHSGVS